MTQGRETPAGVATDQPDGDGAGPPSGALPDPGPPRADGERPERPRRWWGGFTADGLVAVLTWLVLTPLGVLLVQWFDLDPFSVAGVVMPVGVGALAGGIVLALVYRRYSDRLVGVAMGVYASWIALTMATTLHGTPYGFGLLGGDAGRFVAQAIKYTFTSQSTDSFARDLPSEYPPLYPWLVGHLARLVDKPAWQLFGEMQIVVMSAGVVVAYVFWRRLVSAPVAFTIVGLAPAVFNQPSKDYEFVALLVFAPWVIATFAGLPRIRGGLHWLSAGIIGGLIVLSYQAWLLYSALGILLLMGLTLRAAPSRSRYLLHLVGVAGTALVVASWYVIPVLVTMATEGQNRVSDFWMSPSIVDRPLVLGFLQPTPIAAVQLVGLLGMVWYRRTTWWAQPLLLLVVGNYAYRILFLIRTAHDNHTGYLQYTETLIAMVLVTAGVLTSSEAIPALWRRLSPTPSPFHPERAVAVTAVTALVVWAGMVGWKDWAPGPRGIRDSVRAAGIENRGTDAHAEPLPDGSLTRFAPPKEYLHSRFPTSDIERVVTSQLGADARPVVLAYDQRLFAFLPYYGYTSTDRVSANSLLRWDDRAAELTRLAAITDPTEFARASSETSFGPIDVFVLKKSGGAWRWRTITFSPSAFDPATFHVEQLPSNAVVAVRKR